MEKYVFVNSDPSKDFWELNPELQYFPEFGKLKLKNKNSSKIMWAVYLTEDTNSKYYALPLSEKRSIIEEEYLEDKVFDWESDEVKELIAVYPKYAMSKAKRFYKAIYDDFEKTINSLSSKDVPLKEKTTFYSNLERMMEGLNKAAKLVEEEAKEYVEMRGGKKAGMFGRQEINE